MWQNFLFGSFFMLFSVSAYAGQQPGYQIRDTVYKIKRPVFPLKNIDTNSLKESVAYLMKMKLEEVIAEVPAISGIYFIGCPNCHGGAQEMNVLGWKPGMGTKVKCNYCGMVFPNERFPNNREREIIAPSGAKQVYSYYEDSTGYPYYFEAHAMYEKWLWIRPLAEKLAQLWYATKDDQYGDRAAAIAGRFAQVFPDYAVRYDYPHEPVRFFPADQKWPYEGIAPFRGAKWRWWGYDDIPTYLARVYDILMSGYDWSRMDQWIGSETEKRIAKDLLRLGYDFTTANPDDYGNKSPGMYSEMIRVGRILNEPMMVHDAVNRFKLFFSKGFFADGWWQEGSGSYHNMTIMTLRSVLNAIDGYVDPPDWKGERLDHPDLSKVTPLYAKALMIDREAILPNGRKIPVNDTWGYDRANENSGRYKTDSTTSKLWPALGDATLGTGAGENQVLLNVNWSGNYGHSHFDNGSIIFYAKGQELLPDIGYTHSKYRGWSSHTASHNTVVIDQKSQDHGTREKPATGRLLYYDDKNPHVKLIDVDASPAYSMADLYRRKLIMVHADAGYDYVVDIFDVKGGDVHDYFLQGMCEQEGILQTSIPLQQAIESLVPAWGGREVPMKQYDTDPKRFHAYSYLHDIKKGLANDSWMATWKYDRSGLRSFIFSEPGTEVFRYRSPSIRKAKEDDNKLDDFMSNGIMLRHSGGTSTFIAVHEPFGEKPWIHSVTQKDGIIKVRYMLNGSMIEDRIEITGKDVRVNSGAGWKYISGTKITGEVKEVENKNESWNLILDKEIPEASYIRLEFSDGSTYYCPVDSVIGNHILLKDDPGFTLDNEGKVNFYTFPQSRYPGPLRYTIFVTK